MDDKLLAAVCEEISTMGPTRRGELKPTTYPRPGLCSGRIPWHRLAALLWPLPRFLEAVWATQLGRPPCPLSLGYIRACDGDASACPIVHRYYHAVESILEHFVRLLDATRSVPNAEQPPQPPALATPSKSKLVTSVRSLMMHRILRKGKGVTAEELSTKLLADVKLVATRLAHLGPDAICDSPADLEWLADKAFDLGIECIAASEPGAATDTASGGATEDERLGAVDDDALRRSTEFVSASCELRERLPGSDEHLQRLMQGQMVLCRGCVLLAKRRLPAEQRTLLLAKAAKAVEVAFRAYGRTARSRGQLGETRGRLLTVCAPPLSFERESPLVVRLSSPNFWSVDGDNILAAGPAAAVCHCILRATMHQDDVATRFKSHR